MGILFEICNRKQIRWKKFLDYDSLQFGKDVLNFYVNKKRSEMRKGKIRKKKRRQMYDDVVEVPDSMNELRE
jgi:hypothetical protein